jgi:hypothetical protein
MTKARDIASAAPAPAGVTSTELGYVDGVTSAIQTQVDAKIGSTIVDAKGDVIAATAADTVARLAVGANNTVLTADSAEATGLKWAAPAGAGLDLIATSTFSAAASHSVNNCFTSTYTNYRIVADYDSTDVGDNLNLRMRVSGSDNSTAGNYRSSGFYTNWDSVSTGGIASGTSATSMTVGNVSNVSRLSTTFDMCNPFATEETTFQGISLGGAGTIYRGGKTTVTTSYDGFTLIPAAGNMTGTVSVYGYAK